MAGLWISLSQPVLAQNTSEQDGRQKMAQILKKTREYCRRLAQAALDFVCLEEISERIDNSKEAVQFYLRGMLFGEKNVIEEHKFLYDYQFVRKGDRKTEKRILLEEDGLKKREEGAYLKTNVFLYQNVLFGPVNLLDEYWQSFYDYKMIGDELLDGEKALVIEAAPLPSFHKEILWGKIWVKGSDFSILKIEWNQKSMKHFEIIEKTAEKYKAEPQITQITEFGFEKNGIRFPSRYFIEEAYISNKGKKFVRSETSVVYRGYRFFTVETEIKYTLK